MAQRPDLSARELARRLRDETSRLDELSIGELAVRTSADLSYGALNPEEARLYRLIGHFAVGVFSARALEAVASPASVRRSLDRLIEVNLVRISSVDHRGTARYRVHDLLRLHALGVGDQEQKAEAVRDVEAVLDAILNKIRRANNALAFEYFGVLEHTGPLTAPDQRRSRRPTRSRGWTASAARSCPRSAPRRRRAARVRLADRRRLGAVPGHAGRVRRLERVAPAGSAQRDRVWRPARGGDHASRSSASSRSTKTTGTPRGGTSARQPAGSPRLVTGSVTASPPWGSAPGCANADGPTRHWRSTRRPSRRSSRSATRTARQSPGPRQRPSGWPATTPSQPDGIWPRPSCLVYGSATTTARPRYRGDAALRVRQERYDQAVRQLRTSLAIFNGIGDDHCAAYTRAELGRALMARGEVAAARKMLLDAIDMVTGWVMASVEGTGRAAPRPVA